MRRRGRPASVSCRSRVEASDRQRALADHRPGARAPRAPCTSASSACNPPPLTQSSTERPLRIASSSPPTPTSERSSSAPRAGPEPMSSTARHRLEEQTLTRTARDRRDCRNRGEAIAVSSFSGRLLSRDSNHELGSYQGCRSTLPCPHTGHGPAGLAALLRLLSMNAGPVVKRQCQVRDADTVKP